MQGTIDSQLCARVYRCLLSADIGVEKVQNGLAERFVKSVTYSY